MPNEVPRFAETDLPNLARRTNQTRDSEFSVGDVLRKSLSENTRIAYHLAWERFASHCIERKKDPFAATPEDVAEFLVRSATEPRSPTATTRQGQPLALSTIRIALAAINREYREQGIESPASHSRVTSLLRALGRLSGKRQRQVKALREHEIANILSCCDELATDKKYRTISTRDAALFAVGFAGALRRSEICALHCEDIEFLRGTDRHRGMFLHIRRSKTDQIGRGERIAIPYGSLIRPVERIRRWLTVSGIDRGPVFQAVRRGGHPQGRAICASDVARLVKRYVRSIGLDPAEYSGHSLRAGFVTSAAVHRASLDKIMDVTRHRSADMVLRYIRRADPFEDHAGATFL